MTSAPRGRRAAASLIAACCAGAVALAASGCGASNTIDPVARAADLSAAAPGYRVVLAIRESGPSLPMPIDVTGSGSFNVSDHTGQFVMSMKLPALPAITKVLGGNVLTAQEVMRGTTGYVKMPAALMARLGAAGKPWLKLDLAQAPGAAGAMLGAASSNPMWGDPSQFLGYLRGSGGMSNVGREQVAGHSATHYRGHLDLNVVVQRAPSSERAAMGRGIAWLESMGIPKQVPADVWVDGRGLVRELRMTLNATIQGHAMHMMAQELIPQYGRQPEPAAPPASQVTDANRLLGTM